MRVDDFFSRSMRVVLVSFIACLANGQPPRSTVSFIVFGRHDFAPRPLPVRVAEFVDASGKDHSASFSQGESSAITPGRYRYRLQGVGIAAKGYVSVRDSFQIVKIVVDRMPTLVGTGQPVAIDGLTEAPKLSGLVVNRGRPAALNGRAIIVARMVIDGSMEQVGRIDQNGTFQLAGVGPGLVQVMIIDGSGLRHSEMISVPTGSAVLRVEFSLQP